MDDSGFVRINVVRREGEDIIVRGTIEDREYELRKSVSELTNNRYCSELFNGCGAVVFISAGRLWVMMIHPPDSQPIVSVFEMRGDNGELRAGSFYGLTDWILSVGVAMPPEAKD